MSAILLPKESLALETRKKTAVTNYIDRTPCADGVRLQVRDLRRKYAGAKHRPVGPCNTYNCHGLTFASRRAWIHEASVVQTILDDDEYETVRSTDVMPGDIIVYISSGDIEHSGIVVEKEGFTTRVLSKWGSCQEVIHLPHECPYAEAQIKYYRICK